MPNVDHHSLLQELLTQGTGKAWIIDQAKSHFQSLWLNALPAVWTLGYHADAPPRGGDKIAHRPPEDGQPCKSAPGLISGGGPNPAAEWKWSGFGILLSGT
ncbi:MAG: hypothetical protein GY842_05745 [bacterium]|nr:hypothetical protein [bacterium]